MKRSWIGLALLLVMLVLGILTTWAMVRIHEPIAADLRQAAVSTMEKDWDNARRSFDKANQAWERWSHFRACFADHGPVEEIDAGFAELQVYCAAQEDVAFAASCLELSKKVAAVGEAHELVWWNLL